MAADADFEALGLLNGLEGDARQERIELIAWLLDRGFDIDHIRESVAAPLELPATRVFGDHGDYVSAREICRIDGNRSGVLAEGSIALSVSRGSRIPTRPFSRARTVRSPRKPRIILDLGIDPEDAVAVMRVMKESLGHAAAMMREAALKTILKPGVTEIEIAEASEAMSLRAAPTIGRMMEALLRVQLRRSFETEAVTAAERAAGDFLGPAR